MLITRFLFFRLIRRLRTSLSALQARVELIDRGKNILILAVSG